MAHIEKIKVTVESVHQRTSPGEVRVEYFDAHLRLMRALKLLGMLWLGAVFAVFIPIVHFVLVPSLLIAGLVAGYWSYGVPSVVLGGTSTCPECQKPLVIVRGPDKWPLSDLCSECHCTVSIRK